MQLDQVTKHSQFPEYYRQNGLRTTDERIRHLKSAMGIVGVICDYGSTPEEELVGLEDWAIEGIWKAYVQSGVTL